MIEYEFTDSQNLIFRDLAGTLRSFSIQLGIFAALVMFLGLVFAVRGPTDLYTSVAGGGGIILVGGLSLILCFRLLKPIADFREIVTTKGHDLPALMTGLDHLMVAHRTLRMILVLLLLGAGLGLYRLLT